MNKNVLLSYHGVHSDYQQDFRLGMAKTIFKIVLGAVVLWSFIVLVFCLDV